MPLRMIGIAALASTTTALSAAATPPRTAPTVVHAGPVQEGLYEGTGRACGGMLQVSPKRLTWRTPFSQCSAPATLIDSRSEGDTRRWAYRLAQPRKPCLYSVVVIERIETPSPPVFWNVLGYPSVEAYRANEKDARLACYLIKVR